MTRPALCAPLLGNVSYRFCSRPYLIVDQGVVGFQDVYMSIYYASKASVMCFFGRDFNDVGEPVSRGVYF